MKDGYLVDVGALLPEGDPEFDSYSIVYDKQHAFYDSDQYYVIDREEAIRRASAFLYDASWQPGETLYAVITDTWLDDDITQEQIDNDGVDVEGEHYLLEDVIWAAKREDGVIGPLFPGIDSTLVY